ncbi:MAG: 2-hydroxyacid dehydrogenase [Sphingobacteriales bacterium]|nr:2-hydroxyacid dehydrogenase [Sphingobacteriales bacterium]
MKIAFFSTKNYDIASFEAVNNGRHELEFFEEQLNSRNAILAEGFDAVCVFVNDKINSTAIAALEKLNIKAIAFRCAGYNNLNLEVARKSGMKVVRVPAYSPQAVAEHAVALILTLNRKIHKAYNRVRENNFSIENLTGINLYGKTIGVIGTGLIGKAFCEIMLGFGCRVLAHDIFEQEALKQKGINYLSLDDVLVQSDILSLHCPLLPETHHLINKESLTKMKQGAMLINTSRGGLLNTQDVIESLKARHLGYLGIDVYEQEAGIFFRDLSESIIEDDTISRLLTFPNVIITGHQGFFTKEALEQIAVTTLNSFTAIESGQALDERVVIA